MKKYTTPSLEVLQISVNDIIQTSGMTNDGNGDMSELPEGYFPNPASLDNWN